jgi:hypothetical protein
MAQPAVTEERLAPAVVGTQPTAATVAEAQPAEAAVTEARSVAPAAEEAERVQPAAAPVVAEAQPEAVAAEEGGRAPAAAGARPEAVAVAPRQAPAAVEAQVEAPAEAAQGPALAGGSRAEVVEVLDDDSPPPVWDRWPSFPTRSPEAQEGALVRRREGHMVAGDRGHGAEASSPRAGRSAQVEGVAGDPPAFADARGEQELWGELRSNEATLDRVLNEALRVHGGPAWRVFQLGRCCSFSSFSRF